MSESGSGTVGEFIQGEEEPSSSWVVLAFGLVTSLALLVLHGILYPSRDRVRNHSHHADGSD